MRPLAVLVALALPTIAVSARADEAPAPQPSPPLAAGDPVAAEVARQGAAIDRLRAQLDEEKRARENAPVRVSGFLQADWIIHNQASQNEINGSTGAPLNQE